MATFPQLARVRQTFPRPVVTNVAQKVDQQLSRLNLQRQVQQGQSVAITAGSRGIANIVPITSAIVDHVKRLGAQPFVVPAMGSHGGATADGQVRVLEKLGITESTIGCPIRSSMDTVNLCNSDFGFPVLMDRHAFEADHVIVFNRIKPHTSIAGTLESGLVKMMLIGLGKHEGAKIYHGAMADHSFGAIAQGIARQVMQRGKILCGVGIVENAFDETALLQAMLTDDLIDQEQQLLVRAKKLMPRLPFDDIDILVIDRMGKEISGTGIDTNVVGRKFNDNAAIGDEVPRVRRILVRSLTPASGGNGNGIGIADFCRSQLLEQIDRQITNVNAITALHPNAAMIPIDFPTDREMIEAAGQTVGLRSLAESRLVWIRDTLHLNEFVCSEALLPELEASPHAKLSGDLLSMTFDSVGNLVEHLG